ncbi:uncharacterized protein LOC108025585 [Drosophila biarmipes]|uniref:uncharacterized protein LOC108025585 n=1 Tax=Drosophila biarmipes TaxID=125945 RepID=UPI0007E81872|nr:uncharacterized protein LOC108025585 [Drosophila biarmipes]
MKWEPSEVEYTVDFDRLWLVLEVTPEWEFATGELALRRALAGYPEADAGTQCGQHCLSSHQAISNHIPELRSRMEAIEHQQLAIEIKLDAILAEVQGQLELQEATLRESLGTIVTKSDFNALRSEMLSQLPIVSDEVQGLQAPRAAPSNFKLIDSRFFYIEQKIEKTWAEAAVICYRKGGHLAALKNFEEYQGIASKLQRGQKYWLGINNVEHKNEFASLASGERAPFLKWATKYPKNQNNLNFIYIFNGYLYNSQNSDRHFFICQADNEI